MKPRSKVHMKLFKRGKPNRRLTNRSGNDENKYLLHQAL